MTLVVDELVNDDRFSGDHVLHFLLYIPIGLLLACVRIPIGLILWIASVTLPNKSSFRPFISTLACSTFGIHVKHEGAREDKTSLLVANYVSVFDPLAVHHVVGSVCLRKWKIPPCFAAALGIRNHADFVGKQHFAENPEMAVLVQPEGVPTNGKGLLQFKDWPFQICNKIQPVAISVERQFTNVTVHSVFDKPEKFPWSDTMWFLWTPITTYKIKLLPSICRDNGESDDIFVERVREAIAKKLNIVATEHSMETLLSCMKRGRRNSSNRSGNLRQTQSDAQRLALRVKEVLPNVPMADIIKDLARTRNVDITITNFLEGVTPYTPEASQTDPQPGTSAPTSPPRYITPQPTGVFPSNAKDRQLSFQEKKAQMISMARQKYIEKHGIILAS